MKFKKFKSENDESTYFILKSGDLNRVNPVIHYTHLVLEHRTEILKSLTKEEYDKYGIPDDEAERCITKRISDEWKEEFIEMLEEEISSNFFQLLDSTTKSEQEKLMKNQSITSTGLFVFICKSFLEYGFTFSEYKSENFGKGVNKESMPNFIHIAKGNVKKVGDTDLTKGQLKQIVDQRKVIIAKILDKGGIWHCFLLTYRSLSGKESWRDGTPHMHYLSDKWGIWKRRFNKTYKRRKTSIYSNTY